MGKENFDSCFFWDLPFIRYDFKDKKRNVSNLIRYMLSRSIRMFEYENLPETLNERMLELYLQINGYVGIAKFEDNLYCYRGGLGGKPDEYYMPTIYTIANPAQSFFKNAEIGKDVIVISNDSMYTGLMPLNSRYATAIVENELSMQIATINSRISSLISTADDRGKASAEEYLRKIEKGDLGVIAETAFLDGIRVQPYGNATETQAIKNLIEHEQYLKASWWNELGLNANYNMKRETLTDSENAMNSDSLLPLVDDMLECRKRGLEKVNELFGTNISVRLASAWEDNKEELEAEQDMMEAEKDRTEAEAYNIKEEEKQEEQTEEGKEGEKDEKKTD